MQEVQSGCLAMEGRRAISDPSEEEVKMNVRVPTAMIATLLLWSCSSSSMPASTPAPSEKSMGSKDSGAGFYAEESYKERM